MDPDANWAEQQRIRRRIREKTTTKGDLARLRDLQEALNEWIAKGNARPRAWGVR